jgi:NAD dependent epimerase/dehydratase family enzyme
MLAAIGHVLNTPALVGPVNMASPNPVTNRQFTRTLAKTMHRPALLRIPAAMLKLAFGPMAVETILASQNVVPAKLLASGFVFQFPILEDALRDALPS